MSKIVVGTSMSSYGFVNDGSGSVAPLYPDFQSFQNSEPLEKRFKTLAQS